MDGHPPGQWDAEAVARYRDISAGGCHGTAAEQDAAARVAAIWPRAGEVSRCVYDFHCRATMFALQPGMIDGRDWPAARGVIYTVSGYRPSWPGAVLPHEGTGELATDARFAYATASRALWRLWQGTLEGDRRAVAIRAAPAGAASVLGQAAGEGLEPPWSVHLQRAAHYWPPDAAREVIAGYGRLMGPGSTLAISLCVPAPTRAGRELAAVMEEVAGTTVYAHAPGAIRGWIEDAGMIVHPRGITDVRAWPDGVAAADGELGEVPPGQFIEAVALVPLS